MDKKIGFIGCGNMGKAILGGLIASGQVLRVRFGSIHITG
ncbi:pyrroline-5-carboxylate reductase [Enterobacter cloacae]|uniref:Pyrroline-5-carboxylate reductase n=1 Tax=Enterobacter cloacae TaxID=550 RepID=A0A377M6I9_ENTCL|nr:pyrroline-5-carboxylate reductase [Enterobacter cloacae]